jgi:hypothetical protein
VPTSRSLFALALCAAVLPGCSKDSPTSSTGGVSFPTLPSAVVNAYCVRGDRTAGQAISSTLATTACQIGDGTYFESYRVRVSPTGSFEFSASSAFDNILGVLRLESTTVPGGPQDLISFIDSGTVTLIDYNDDRSGTDLNALIAAVDLSAGTDYLIVFSGFGATDVGPYTVAFTKN